MTWIRRLFDQPSRHHGRARAVRRPKRSRQFVGERHDDDIAVGSRRLGLPSERRVPLGGRKAVTNMIIRRPDPTPPCWSIRVTIIAQFPLVVGRRFRAPRECAQLIDQSGPFTDQSVS
jgi:hypothetical protein